MKTLSLLALSLGLSLSVSAAEVDSSSVTTFSSGTVVSSADMNATISALVTAINDNAATIAEMQTKLDEYEAALADIEGTSVTLLDVVNDSTYRMVWTSNGTNYDSATAWAGIITEVGSALITFNSDGTGNYAEENAYREIDTERSCTDESDSSTCTRNVDEDTGTESADFTWTLEGNTLTVLVGDETATFALSDNGQTMIGTKPYWTETTDNGSTIFETDLNIAVKISE